MVLGEVNSRKPSMPLKRPKPPGEGCRVMQERSAGPVSSVSRCRPKAVGVNDNALTLLETSVRDALVVVDGGAVDVDLARLDFSCDGPAFNFVGLMDGGVSDNVRVRVRLCVRV